MSDTITPVSERLARKTLASTSPAKLHWSLHFGVLGQVCMLESENSKYKLKDCVETSRLVMQCRQVNKSINIASPKQRSLSPSAKPVLAKNERSQTTFNDVISGVRNCIEVSMAMNRKRSNSNNMNVYRSLKVKNAANVLNALSAKKRHSLDESALENKEDRTLPVIRMNTTVNNSNEALTPFQAVKGIRRDGPSYWISCQYIYLPQNGKLELVVRQTGVLPESKHINHLSKITLEVKMAFGKGSKQKQRVVLKKSGIDNSFKSSRLHFAVTDAVDLRQANASFRIYVEKLFSKKVVSNWNLDMSDCTYEQTKNNLTKVEFSS